MDEKKDQAAGKAKELMGKATGDERMQGEGKAQNIAGKGKEAVHDAADAAQGAVEGAKQAATRRRDD